MTAEEEKAPPPSTRAVRSFVRRAGRLTPAQSRALEELLPRYGVADKPCVLTTENLFARNAPLILEIGFGNGDALAWMAQQQPDAVYLGIEVHRPGIGHLLRRLSDEQIENVRVMEGDAVEILQQRIAPNSLGGLRIYFPDPWPKKRHVKRRLIQPGFIKLATSRLAPGGVLHAATDWEPYAEQMMTVLSAAPGLFNQQNGDGFAPRPKWRPETRFERRGLKLGHGVWDLLFTRQEPME